MTRVLIIGSSRSGTGVMVRVLGASGFDIGHDRSPNQESWIFQRLNRWLLFNAGGGLETPETIDVLLADPIARRVATAIVRAHVTTWETNARACFKDPRTTFTLPIWLEVFAEAKVIHMVRHGIDVAASLVARRARVNAKWTAPATFTAEVAAHLELVETQRVVANLRMTTIPEALVHWRRYVMRAIQHTDALGDRLLTVRYEDLVLAPRATLQRVSAFVGVPVTAGDVALDATRAYAHRRVPSLLAQAVCVPRGLLHTLGYAD